MRPVAPLLAVLTACSSPILDDATSDSTLPEGAIDERTDWSTDRPNTVAFRTPDYVVPPYTDQTLCTFMTYEGEEAGVPWAGFYQNLKWGHHVVLSYCPLVCRYFFWCTVGAKQPPLLKQVGSSLCLLTGWQVLACFEQPSISSQVIWGSDYNM